MVWYNHVMGSSVVVSTKRGFQVAYSFRLHDRVVELNSGICLYSQKTSKSMVMNSGDNRVTAGSNTE
jgi:hypothetical protein